jgi:ubiquitin-small subunit ribosomal protein S27Ae
MAAPAKPAAKTAGKPAAKGAKKGRWNLYEKAGDKVTRKNKSCPKCGHGTFMAQHKDRSYCGYCHYTEFSSKQ